MIGVVALAGCVTVQSPQTSRQESLALRFERMLDSIQVASTLEPGEVVSAPRIRIVVPPASFASTRYVDASFHVSGDAYVLVVAVDLDRRLRVVYPESPDETGFAARSASTRLSRFFAGFGGPRAGVWSRYEAQYSPSQRISPFGGGGVLLAIASDRPLQYDRLIGQDGDWDEQQLAQIVFDQSLSGAAHALGRALVLTGQEFNTDYTTFNGRRSLGAYSTLASASYDGCSFGSSYGSYGFDSYGFDSGFGAYEGGPVTRFVGFYQRNGQTYARYGNVGPCSRPVFYDVPVATPVPAPPVVTPPDTATQRPRRFPGAPRFPSVTGDNEAASHRFSPSNLRDAGRERPLVASGLRFRPPEQVPADPVRPLGRAMSPRDASDSPARRVPVSNEERRMRPADDRRSDGESSRVTERYTRPQREERQAQPERPEPVRVEPARSEPAHREPVQREPLPAMPSQPTPL